MLITHTIAMCDLIVNNFKTAFFSCILCGYFFSYCFLFFFFSITIYLLSSLFFTQFNGWPNHWHSIIAAKNRLKFFIFSFIFKQRNHRCSHVISCTHTHTVIYTCETNKRINICRERERERQWDWNFNLKFSWPIENTTNG